MQRDSEFIPIIGLTLCSSCSLPCFTYSNSSIKIDGIIHLSKASGMLGFNLSDIPHDLVVFVMCFKFCKG